jgi:hypothetical protein
MISYFVNNELEKYVEGLKNLCQDNQPSSPDLNPVPHNMKQESLTIQP